MNDERRYSQAELRAIFERAAERQEAASRAESASGGQLTLAELQEIGAASGIDPAHVAAAAAELASWKRASAPSQQTRWPRQALAERVVPGPVSDDAWEAMVSELRRSLGKPGIAGQVGRTREWTTMSSGGRHPDVPISVTLQPEGDQTRLTIMQSWQEYTRVPLIIGTVFSFMALLLGGVLAFNEPAALFMPVIFASVALLIFGAGPAGLRAMARRQEAKFEHILDRLDLIARDTALPVQSTHETSEPSTLEGRISLDDVEREDQEATLSVRNRTRS